MPFASLSVTPTPRLGGGDVRTRGVGATLSDAKGMAGGDVPMRGVGATLGDASWIAKWWERVEVLTPNGPEAALLSGVDVQSADDAIRAGEALLARGVSAVLVKGGHHAAEDRSVDMLVTAGGVRRFERARVPHDIHGTGCALSSAIAAGLAQGRPVEDAIERAFGWMTAAIAGARRTGAGRMVLDFGAAPPADV